MACHCGEMLCEPCTKHHSCEDGGCLKHTLADQYPSERPPLRPHQAYGIAEVTRLMQEGQRRIMLTSPTGGGKTRMMLELTEQALDNAKRVVIYSHRKLLTTQISDVLDGAGVEHGVMAAGWQRALLRRVQVASIWSVNSQVYTRQNWDLHDAHLVMVDEAHANTHPTASKIMDDHLRAGATIIGVTATPVGCRDHYDTLVQAGVTSELRKYGALVPCATFGPDEPDLGGLRTNSDGEFSQEEIAKRFRGKVIFGRVFENLLRINPHLKPTVLFAPGVPESRQFAEELTARGIPSASIDESTPEALRQEIIQANREGDIKVVCNRFVLREGVDMPWLSHCIFACTFGALHNYLQAGGRVLRAFPGLQQVTIQDHGGMWWRHGSLNEDRHWSLDDTATSVTKERKERFEKGEEKEPLCCPECGKILDARSFGGRCPVCGHEFKRSKRTVVQLDGTLVELRGNVHKKKKETTDAEKLWNGIIYPMLNSTKRRWTLRDAAFAYHRKAKTMIGVPPWPQPGLRGVPAAKVDDLDWNRPLDQVLRKGGKRVDAKGRKAAPKKHRGRDGGGWFDSPGPEPAGTDRQDRVGG